MTLSDLERRDARAQASEAGVCRGSDTPTIYVGILICIFPLEKSNTYPCKLYATDAGKGNLMAQNTRKPFGGRVSAPDPAG